METVEERTLFLKIYLKIWLKLYFESNCDLKDFVSLAEKGPPFAMNWTEFSRN